MNSLRRARSRERGQALLATLFILAFLAILTVAMLSYASVTQAQYDHAEQTAKQNASIEGAVDAGLITAARSPELSCASGVRSGTGSMTFPAGTGSGPLSASQLFPAPQTLNFQRRDRPSREPRRATAAGLRCVHAIQQRRQPHGRWVWFGSVQGSRPYLGEQLHQRDGLERDDTVNEGDDMDAAAAVQQQSDDLCERGIRQLDMPVRSPLSPMHARPDLYEFFPGFRGRVTPRPTLRHRPRDKSDTPKPDASVVFVQSQQDYQPLQRNPAGRRRG